MFRRAPYVLRISIISTALLFIAGCGTPAPDVGVGGEPVGDTGPAGPQGPAGPSGPVDSRPPGVPGNLRVFAKAGAPGVYEIRWTIEASPVAIDSFVVYESSSAIGAPDSNLIAGIAPGAARAADVRLFYNSGERHFRVSAVSYTGVESPLSPEYVVDTRARILFTADADIDNTYELYTIPADGNAARVKISGTMVAGGNVKSAKWSWDARKIAFVADKEVNDTTELYVASPSGGSEPMKVSGSLQAGADVVEESYEWSPDGKWLSYLAQRDDLTSWELMVTDATGATPPRSVSGAMGPRRSVQFFLTTTSSWSPDGSHLLFVADRETDEKFEAYVARVDGSTPPVKVSGTIVDDRGVHFSGGMPAVWSPDGSRLAFVKGTGQPARSALWVARPDGLSEPINVSGTMVDGGEVKDGAFRWSPDGSRLAFVANKLDEHIDELFIAAADGSSEPQRISGTTEGQNGDVEYGLGMPGISLEWSPDGTRIAFLARKMPGVRNELYVASAGGGGEPVKVSGTLVSGGRVGFYFWSPLGDSLLMMAAKEQLTSDEVYVAPADGAHEPIKISGTMVAGGSVEHAANLHFTCLWSADARSVAFVADKDVDEQTELYVATAGAFGEPLKVSGVLGANADVGGEFPMGLSWSPLAIDGAERD